MKKEKDTTKNNTSPAGFHKAVPIILLAVAVFIGICYVTANETGLLGHAISSVFLGLFSIGAYFIPFLIAIHAIFYYSDIKEKRLLSRIIFSLLTVLAVSALTHVIMDWNTEAPVFDATVFYEGGMSLSGGGLVGGAIAFGIRSIMGRIGVIIVTSVIFAIYLIFFFSKTDTLVNIGRAIVYGVLTVFAFFEKIFKKIGASFSKNKKKLDREAERIDDFADDEFFDVDNGLSSLEIKDLGIVENRSEEALEQNPTLSEQVHHRSEAIEGEGRQRTVRDIAFEDADDCITGTTASDASIIYGDSADAVFKGDFDPYNIAMAERMANKASTSGVGRSSYNPTTVTETIDEIDERELERIRREAEFERAKARAEAEAEREQLIREARRRAYSEAPYQSPDGGKSVAFNIREDEVIEEAPEEIEAVSMTVEKSGDSVYHEVTYDYREVESDEGSVSFTRESESTPTYTYNSASYEAEDDEDNEDQDFSLDLGGNITDRGDGITVERTPIVERAPIVEPTREEPRSFIFDVEDDIDEEEATDEVAEEIPVEEQNPDILDWRRRFEMFRREDSKNGIIDDEPDLRESITSPYGKDEEHDFDDIEDEYEDEPPFEQVTRVTKPEQPKREKKSTPFKNYQLPPIDLLSPPDESDEDDAAAKAEIEENISILTDTLASFGVTASIKGVDRGPRITRYEVVPAKGVRVNQITNLFNDITLALASEGVRMEAPIPGKAAIGFEVPNRKSVIVKLRELLETPEYTNSKSSTFVCVGKDVAGTPVFGDIEKYPHALVAGATNMGKSVCINSIILSMLYHAKPNELRFILIDPKKVEFKVYSGIPHLLVPVVTESKQAAGALMWAVDEMERRYNLMEEHNAKNIKEYNALVAANPSIGEPASRIIIVIDELNDLMMQVRNPVESLIMRLAQKARAAGIHLIIGTQRPDVKVITGTIKANIPTRISCKVTSQVDSRTILEQIGAEKLLPYGDILYKPPEKTSPVRVQGAYVSSSEVEEIVKFIKSQVDGECYDESVLNEINKAAQKCGNKKGDSLDDFDDEDDSEECGYYSDQQFLDAVEVAIRSRKVSTSLLQRKMKIGFSKAARYVDAMEEIGIVSEPNGQKPRDVLITMDEWHEKLSRVNIDD